MRENVIAAYRVLLGREPENDAVVEYLSKVHKDIESILKFVISSAEYKSKHREYRDVVRSMYSQKEYRIDVDVKPDVEEKILKRIVEQWTVLGETDPYWSVLSAKEFKMESIEGNKEKFYRSGKTHGELVELFCHRNSVDVPRGTCMELGCGVGRVTRFLADRFNKVIGFDVSSGNLRLAKEYIASCGLNNVDFRLLRNLNDLETSESYDFFFSIIVLQHNPPPVIKRLLELALAKLQPGGVFLFQVPTHRLEYSYDSEKYIEEHDLKEAKFEMHSIPMHVVLDLLDRAGCQPKEVIADTFNGVPGSHTFFGVKKGAAQSGR